MPVMSQLSCPRELPGPTFPLTPHRALSLVPSLPLLPRPSLLSPGPALALPPRGWGTHPKLPGLGFKNHACREAGSALLLRSKGGRASSARDRLTGRRPGHGALLMAAGQRQAPELQGPEGRTPPDPWAMSGSPAVPRDPEPCPRPRRARPLCPAASRHLRGRAAPCRPPAVRPRRSPGPAPRGPRGARPRPARPLAPRCTYCLVRLLPLRQLRCLQRERSCA